MLIRDNDERCIGLIIPEYNSEICHAYIIICKSILKGNMYNYIDILEFNMLMAL